MINRSQLLSDLQTLLRQLEADLAERSDVVEVPEVGETLRAEYNRAKEPPERTAMSFEEWRSGYGTQVAVAWVLAAVFARFLEDNGLVEVPKISGSALTPSPSGALTPSPSPQGEGSQSLLPLLPGEKGAGGMRANRLQRARDEHEVYFRSHPTETDREYLLQVFRELGQLPGMGAIFLEQNPVFELPNWLSGDAAGELLRFFQKIDPATGALVHDFTDPEWDTRFLGDLYQDLSEAARKQYALLQTPIFVEEFILDRTLDPAIEEFGLPEFRMIDPACGSGHFLLGAFERILDRWQKQEPGTNVRALAQRALDAVHGVDVNPYAIAIARFRLLLAAMKASGITTLRNAPGFKFRLACGDSLIHGDWRQLEIPGLEDKQHHYSIEDINVLNAILVPNHYHAVVANPPYIVPKDKKQNEEYRKRYESCHRQYSMAVPFMERLFQLAIKNGFTGQITANSFMKREFGKKLIEQFFPKVDLTHVIDTSGAYIPGHGTPTVILFGRNRTPVAKVIRTVMGIRGEPSTPEDAAQGLVWSAILQQVDVEGSESEFVSVADSQREIFYSHPWSIGGGGASELKEWLENNSKQSLVDFIEAPIGRAVRIGEEDGFIFNQSRKQNSLRPDSEFRGYLIGENVRDWSLSFDSWVWYPYQEESHGSDMVRQLWSWRTLLANRSTFQGLMADAGLEWFDYMQHTASAYRTPLSIAFAFVATHNHFVLDRGGKVFNRSAPVIKLPAGATEDEHLALLGLLNSSTACFWMKQVFFPKGGDQVGSEGARIRKTWWDERYEFAGTGLQSFPLAKDYPTARSQILDSLASLLTSNSPEVLLQAGTNNLRDRLKTVRSKWEKILSQMISQQEELDWECYRLYNIVDEDLTYSSELPPIHLGQRAFEIIMARQIKTGNLETAWFDRHNSTPITELPADWPDDYKQLVERRIHLIKTDKNIGLIEQPEYKRRWNTELWESQLQRALETWLLNRLESYFDFDGRMAVLAKHSDTISAEAENSRPNASPLQPTLISTAKLADLARQDADFLQVGELYRNDPAFNVQTLIDDLVDKETVPLLPSLRYKPSGLRKRADWEHTWHLQRQEDAIDARTQLPKDHPDHLDSTAAKRLKETEIGPIPVPPKYATSDFQKPHYWKLRGKLDVPKERWVSFPHCEGPDGFPVIAWAGYNHLQLAQAISAYYVDVQENFGGRDDPRLVPLLGGLLELLPWLKQWHNELDADYGLKMGDYYAGFIEEEARQMGLTLEDIGGWQPPQKKAKGRKKR
jgi:hypothetical protein